MKKNSMNALRNKVDELPTIKGESGLLKRIDAQIAYGRKYIETERVMVLFYNQSSAEYEELKEKSDKIEQEKADAAAKLAKP